MSKAKKDPAAAPATDDPATPPAGEQPPATPPATEPKAKTYTEAEMQANLAKEKKAWEKQVKDAEDRAELSETERAQAERDDALQKLRMRDTRDAVIEAATAAGIKNPKLFYNAYQSDIETDDKGKITNLKDVLAVAKTESPELFASALTPEGSADGGTGKTGDGAKPEFKGGLDRMAYAYGQSAEKS